MKFTVKDHKGNSVRKTYLPTSEAAEYLSISTLTLRKLRERGLVRMVMIGNKQLYNLSDLDAFLEEKRVL